LNHLNGGTGDSRVEKKNNKHRVEGKKRSAHNKSLKILTKSETAPVKRTHKKKKRDGAPRGKKMSDQRRKRSQIEEMTDPKKKEAAGKLDESGWTKNKNSVGGAAKNGGTNPSQIWVIWGRGRKRGGGGGKKVKEEKTKKMSIHHPGVVEERSEWAHGKNPGGEVTNKTFIRDEKVGYEEERTSKRGQKNGVGVLRGKRSHNEKNLSIRGTPPITRRCSPQGKGEGTIEAPAGWVNRILKKGKGQGHTFCPKAWFFLPKQLKRTAAQKTKRGRAINREKEKKLGEKVNPSHKEGYKM